MLGCYRTGEAHDPETYIAGVVAVLERYPVAVIQAVTDPSSGIPSRLKWLPSIAEIREICDRYGPSVEVRWAMNWERSAQRQVAMREQLTIEHQKHRKTYAEIQAEFAEVGIHFGDKKSAPTDVQKFCAEHGISREQWDAIPNAPKD